MLWYHSQQRKGLPVNLPKGNELERGEFDFRVKDNIIVYKWMDRKPVYLISNFHGSEQSEVLRTMKNDSRQSRLFRALYGVDRKSYKWWHRIFFGFVDRAMANAYICYLKSGFPKIPNLEFRKKVTLGLLSLGHAPKVGRPLATLAVNVVK